MLHNLLDSARAIHPINVPGSLPGLPIFKLDRPRATIFYTPGMVAVASSDLAKKLNTLFEGKPVSSVPDELIRFKNKITSKAEESRRNCIMLRDSPFEPECLTIHPHNSCNLACTYCLGAKRERTEKKLKVETAVYSAGLVASNCRRKGIPLSVVFHGWGEPTYDFDLLKSIVGSVAEVAKKTGVQEFRYIATNGVLSSEIAEFLALNFDCIGLSCDGPEDIQDTHRFYDKPAECSNLVRRTASILRQHAKRLLVRTTITSRTISRQEEIVDYIIRELRPHEIHIEPVYRDKDDVFTPDDALEFLHHLDLADKLACEHGVKVVFSGSRLEEIHGPYCNVFRNVLNLTPTQKATACFIEDNIGENNRFCIGSVQEDSFVVNQAKVRQLKTALAQNPEGCELCFNQYHCVRLCPDKCMLDDFGERQKKVDDTFRCRVQLLFSAHQILECVQMRMHTKDNHPFLELMELSGPSS